MKRFCMRKALGRMVVALLLASLWSCGAESGSENTGGGTGRADSSGPNDTAGAETVSEYLSTDPESTDFCKLVSKADDLEELTQNAGLGSIRGFDYDTLALQDYTERKCYVRTSETSSGDYEIRIHECSCDGPYDGQQSSVDEDGVVTDVYDGWEIFVDPNHSANAPRSAATTQGAVIAVFLPDSVIDPKFPEYSAEITEPILKAIIDQFASA